MGGRLLATAPITRARLASGVEVWVALGHDVVRSVLTDTRFSRTASLDPAAPRVAPGLDIPDVLVTMDGAEHARVRKLLTKAFTPRMIEQLRPSIEATVEDLLDEVERHGPPIDLVEHFTMPLPVRTICQLLGVPYEDQERFRDLSDRTRSSTAYSLEEVLTATFQLQQYMRDLVAAKREHPADDLTSELATAADERGTLTEDQLVKNLLLVLIAGFDTTLNQLSNSVVALLRRPAQFEQLRQEPGLVPGAVEELLRFLMLSPTGMLIRIATDDLDLGGERIRAGEGVLALANVANRDPAVFDDPEELDLTRVGASRHLSFGAGPHFCFGAQLARQELQSAITGLLRRFPTLRAAGPLEDIPWKEGLLLRGPKSVLVEW
ncbi:cytochrome P450 [Solihabitans fulvus]|nr:cytochrome P450 [Solihabitans fulvus]